MSCKDHFDGMSNLEREKFDWENCENYKRMKRESEERSLAESQGRYYGYSLRHLSKYKGTRTSGPWDLNPFYTGK